VVTFDLVDSAFYHNTIDDKRYCFLVCKWKLSTGPVIQTMIALNDAKNIPKGFVWDGMAAEAVLHAHKYNLAKES
jgi:hypothetical protein